MGSIERRYKPCSRDGGAIADNCWVSDNATMTFGGVSSELVQVTSTLPGATEWRLENDENWRIFRFTGATNGDNDGEWWEVSTPDGTKATFGRGVVPSPTGSFDHKSALTVPVVGNHGGEPCNGEPNEMCDQAYRWMLDTVTDTNGNTQSFLWDKEQNFYDALGGVGSPRSYDMAARLWRVEYGETAGDLYSVNDVGVNFDYEYRCIALTGCSAPDENNALDYPDVPNDLICPATATSCDEQAPSYFTAYRLVAANTWVREGGLYGWVDRIQFRHDWTCGPLASDPGVCADNPQLATKLWLRGIQRIGSPTMNAIGVYQPDTGKRLPPIRFDAVDTDSLDWKNEEIGQLAFPNRSDFAESSGYRMLMYRITQVRDELGGVLQVTYGQPQGCIGKDPQDPEGPYELPAAGYVDNSTNCYPQWTSAAQPGDDGGDPGGPSGWGLFNKYVVIKTKVIDMTPDSVEQITRYEYGNTGDVPPWGYTEPDWSVYKSWNTWRGYSEVTVRTTDNTDAPAMTRHLLLRGMNGDYVPSWFDPDQKRDATIDTIADDLWLAGYERETRSMRDGDPLIFSSGTDETAVVNTPTVSITADTGLGTARRVRTEFVDSYTNPKIAPAASARDGGLRSTVKTVYNEDGFPSRVTRSSSDPNLAYRCTAYAYATNTEPWIRDRVKSELTFDGNCPDPISETTAVAATYYNFDDQNTPAGWNTAPTKGNMTWKRVSTGATYLTTTTEYDPFGRVKTVIDAKNNTTKTEYSPSATTVCTDTWPAPVSGPFRKTKTTNPKTWQSCDTIDPGRGAPTESLDVNGNITKRFYDQLGRISKVLLPGVTSTTNPSYEFVYAIYEPPYTGNDQPDPEYEPLPIPGHVVTTIQLQSASPLVKLYSYAVIDSLGRTRQTQRRSDLVDATKWVVSGDTRYDGRGLAVESWSDYTFTGAAGQAGVLAPAAGRPTGPRSVATYDAVGRVLTSTQHATTAADAPLETVTTYDGWHTTVNPPGIETTETRTELDAYGRTARLVELGNAGVDSVTTYAYTPRDEVARVTDHYENATTYTYDLAGRRLTVDDPDQGVTTYTYDLNSNVETTVDSRGNLVWYKYDALNRKQEQRLNGATGSMLAYWGHDWPTGSKGLLTSTYRYEPDGASQATGLVYDSRYRLTRKDWAFNPAPQGYSYSYTYDEADHQTSVNRPAQGGLPAEIVTTGYDSLGRPNSLASNAASLGNPPYVKSTAYDDIGLLNARLLGGNTVGDVTRTYGYDGHRRLDKLSTSTPGSTSTLLADSTFNFDETGNIARIDDGLTGQSECFDYDSRSRLTLAYTAVTPASGPCGPHDATAPDPYTESYTFDPIGRITSRGEQTYFYNPGRPHAIDSANGVTYTYDDADGAVDTRTAGTGQSQQLTWDETGLMEMAEDPTCTPGQGCTSGYVYDADGARIIQRHPDGSETYYVGGDEIHRAAPDGPHPVAAFNSARNPAPNPFIGPQVTLPANSLIVVTVASQASAIGGRTTTVTDSNNQTWTETPGYSCNGCDMQNQMFTRTTTAAETATLTITSAGTPTMVGWSVHVAAFTNAERTQYYSIASDSGTTALADDYVPSVGARRPVSHYRYSSIGQVGSGTPISPATSEMTELHESATATPNLQVQAGMAQTALWSVTAGQRWQTRSIGIRSKTLTAARTYTIGGAAVGVRAEAGYSITTGDHHGTGSTVVKPDGTHDTRRYSPYGAARESASPTWPNSNGYLNQPADKTGLSQLGARYYDPITQAFISIDPLVDATRQPYVYGAGNPVMLSDPNGTDPGWAHDTDPCNDAGYYSCREVHPFDPGWALPWGSIDVGCGPRSIAEGACNPSDPDALPFPIAPLWPGRDAPRDLVPSTLGPSAPGATGAPQCGAFCAPPPPMAPGTQVPESNVIDFISSVTSTVTNVNTLGACGQTSIGIGLSVTIGGCTVFDGDNTRIVAVRGMGGQVGAGATLSSGPIVSNAASSSEILGPAVCVGGSGTLGIGGGGDVCASLTSDLSGLTGIWTVYGTAKVGLSAEGHTYLTDTRSVLTIGVPCVRAPVVGWAIGCG